MIKKSEIKDMPLDKMALLALKRAVKNARKEHKLRGKPFSVWRDGKVVRIPAKDL